MIFPEGWGTEVSPEPKVRVVTFLSFTTLQKSDFCSDFARLSWPQILMKNYDILHSDRP